MPYAEENDHRFLKSEEFKDYALTPGLIEYLKSFVNAGKLERINEVLSQRTNKFTVLLEEVFKLQNVGAIIRTCDCFGLQNLHFIESETKFKVSLKTTQGSAKWVDVNPYDSTKVACETLKNKGYKLVATTPHTDMSIDDLPVDEPLALMFGNEKEGLSDEAFEMADYKVKIPMYGFTESFNISVSAALCLNTLSTKVRKLAPESWTLDEDEKKIIEAAWVCKSLDRFDTIAKTFKK